jgi:hypothetical protein
MQQGMRRANLIPTWTIRIENITRKAWTVGFQVLRSFLKGILQKTILALAVLAFFASTSGPYCLFWLLDDCDGVLFLVPTPASSLLSRWLNFNKRKSYAANE